MKYFLVSGQDEFNTLNCVNYVDKILSSDESYVASTGTFDVLFPNVDRIIIPKEVNCFNSSYFLSEAPMHRNVNNVDLFRHLTKEYFRENNIDCFDARKSSQEFINDHVYSFMFKTISKQFQENKLNWILPKKFDYLLSKNGLRSINKPIITIVGRNIEKIPKRNELLRSYISELIRLGAYVINTTISKPNLDFNNDSYYEVDNSVFTYSDQASLFLNSNCVIAVGNAAGISTHLTVPCNILSFPVNGETWVNSVNDDFRYNGKSIIEARKLRSEVKTIWTEFNDLSVLETCMNFEKPLVNSFFDESKLIYI